MRPTSARRRAAALVAINKKTRLQSPLFIKVIEAFFGGRSFLLIMLFAAAGQKEYF